MADFILAVNFSPDYCYRSLQNNTHEVIIDSIIRLRNDDEKAKYNFTTELSVGYLINKRIIIEAGLQYSNKGFRTIYSDLTYGDMIDPRYGFSYQASTQGPDEVRFIYNFMYLDIPVRFIFNPGDAKFSFLASLGLTPSVYLNATQKSILNYENGDKKVRRADIMGYKSKSIMLSAAISAGAKYRINQKISITAEPILRFGFTPANNNDLTQRLWSTGVLIGGNYSF